MRPAAKIAAEPRARTPLFLDEDVFRFQSHWRRFSVAIVAAALSCAMLVAGFAEILISERPAPPRPTSAIEATLIEPLPPKPAEPPKPIPVAPILHPKRKTLARIKPRPAPPPLEQQAQPNPEPAALPGSTAGGIATGRATVPSESEGVGTGTGTGGGAAESIGARALYDPTPQIPDDLRETVFSALAIAHFVVDSQGQVEVTLVKPTANPRLNQIILDSLRTWKFFPAIKDGVPIASEFDIRIPIAVQ